jgi:hypothetical protein
MFRVLCLRVCAAGFCFWAEIIPMPGSAARNAATERHSPKMSFSGRIVEHKSGGLVVYCDEQVGVPPEGYGPQDVLGEFFLVGHTVAETLPDDERIRFDAYRSGLHTYLITLGRRGLCGAALRGARTDAEAAPRRLDASVKRGAHDRLPADRCGHAEARVRNSADRLPAPHL